jgi:hypothetical protein
MFGKEAAEKNETVLLLNALFHKSSSEDMKTKVT